MLNIKSFATFFDSLSMFLKAQSEFRVILGHVVIFFMPIPYLKVKNVIFTMSCQLIIIMLMFGYQMCNK